MAMKTDVAERRPARPRRASPPGQAAPGRAGPRQRPVALRQRPVALRQPRGPAAPARPPAVAAEPAGSRLARADRAAAASFGPLPSPPRAPFVALVVCLLAGGLVCLLVINTTLAAAALRITRLQGSDARLSQQVQSLQQQVAGEQSPASIERRAWQLGMRPQQTLNFVDLQTGRIYREWAMAGPGGAGVHRP
jgi:hypothetical protein